MLTYKRGNAAVCGVFSMNDRMEGLKHAVGEGAGVYIVEDGMLNGIDGKEDNLGIVEETKKQEKVFRYWRVISMYMAGGLKTAVCGCV